MTGRSATRWGSILVVALVATACGGGAPSPRPTVGATPSATSAAATPVPPTPGPSVAGCVPQCLPQADIGERPVRIGPFTPYFFFAGQFSIDLDEGWTAEESTNELVLHHRGPPDWFIFAWIDPFPVENLHRVDGVERAPAALIASWRANPTLITKPVAATTVANGIPAVAVDLSVSDKATIEVSDCPDLCTNYIGFENGPEAHGLARPGITRIYLAPITYGGQSHLLTVSYEAIDPATFASQLTHAEQLIATIRMPVEPGATAAELAMPSGRLVFERWIGESGSLVTTNTDGTATEALLPAGESPHWSPNGRHISVLADGPQGRLFVGLVDPDGSHYVQFDSPDPTLDLGCFAWSPDGSRLACEGWDETDDSRNGLYTVRASDGGDLLRVTTNPNGAHDIPTDFSPDGRQIVFTRQQSPDEADVSPMVVDVNGSDVRSLTDQRIGAGRWSPDGMTILTELSGSLVLLPIDGGAARTIKIASGTALNAGGGAWSPDGEWIVFSGQSTTGFDLYVVRPDGTDLRRVIDSPGIWEGAVDWSR